jgi:hypothetical protein
MTIDLPVFSILAMPTCVPPELEKILNHVLVQVELTDATECVYESTESAGDLVEKIKQTIERQSTGFFFLAEVVQVLLESRHVFNFKDTREKILMAQRRGDLPTHEINNYLKIDVENLHSYNGNWGLVRVDELNVWLKSQGVDYRFLKAEQPLNGNVADSSLGAVIPIQRAAAQNAAILAAIKNKGYQANSLPKHTSGKSGVKALIRAAVATNTLFQGTVFDKTWERLRSSGEIADAI